MAINIEEVPKLIIEKEQYELMSESERNKIWLTELNLLYMYIDNIIIQVKKANLKTIRVMDKRK